MITLNVIYTIIFGWQLYWTVYEICLNQCILTSEDHFDFPVKMVMISAILFLLLLCGKYYGVFVLSWKYTLCIVGTVWLIRAMLDCFEIK